MRPSPARQPLLFLLLIGLSLGGFACSSAPAIVYYTLDPLPQTARPVLAETASVPKRIGIGPVQLPTYLERAQIVTRAGDHTLAVNDFHRWAGPLDEEIVRILAVAVGETLHHHVDQGVDIDDHHENQPGDDQAEGFFQAVGLGAIKVGPTATAAGHCPGGQVDPAVQQIALAAGYEGIGRHRNGFCFLVSRAGSATICTALPAGGGSRYIRFCPSGTGPAGAVARGGGFSSAMLEIQIGIEFGSAGLTEAVGKLGVGMLVDIVLQLMPIPLVIPDLLAIGTDGQQPAEGLYLSPGLLQLVDQIRLDREHVPEAQVGLDA